MPKWSFLFITDLHYADANNNFEDDPKDLTDQQKRIRESVFTDLHELLDPKLSAVAPLSFIAIGGDLSTHGQQAGFDSFLEGTYKKLSQLMPGKKAAICVVPGNHDVIWGLDPGSKSYFEDKFSLFSQAVEDGRGMTTCLFPTGAQNATDPQNDRLSFREPQEGPIYWDHDNHVVVVTINSAIRCGEINSKMIDDLKMPALADRTDEPVLINRYPQKHQSHLIRDIAQVTQPQLAMLRRLLNQEKERKVVADWEDYLRVALIHHHIAPYQGQQTEHKGYEAMLDSSRVLEFLTSNDFDVVLCGHKHHPYITQWTGGKEIVIIGGPTVGGYSQGHLRGINFVEVTSHGRGRQVRVWDVPHAISKGNLKKELRKILAGECRTGAVSPKPAFEAGEQQAGFSYGDVVSITRLREDGDAQRVLEYHDLKILRETARSRGHEVELPHTSGYLDFLEVRENSPMRVWVKRGLPENQESSWAQIELKFPKELGATANKDQAHNTYEFEWYTINAFAMDTDQHVRKYGKAPDSPKTEYTHFVPVDPMGRLTVIVQFPETMKLPHGVTLRIAKVDGKNRDADKWEPDEEERQHLEEIGALRFFDVLNIATLRVKVPKKNTSYGIEWTLPQVTVPRLREETRFLTEQLRSAGEKDTLHRLSQILQEARKVVLHSWEGQLDAALMIFDQKDDGGVLSNISAGIAISQRAQFVGVPVDHRATLKYGDGIAGRAFKANRIRLWKDPRVDEGTPRRYGNDFYKHVPGTIQHRWLMSFPVHYPVTKPEFEKDRGTYSNHRPYGVVSIGSESSFCPVNLMNPQGEQLLGLQHIINRTLAEAGPVRH